MFEDTKHKDTAVLEQSYEYDLVSNKKLLEKFLDREINATEKKGRTYTGTLLSNDGGVVFRMSSGKVVTLSEITNVEFPDSPKKLILWIHPCQLFSGKYYVYGQWATSHKEKY